MAFLFLSCSDGAVTLSGVDSRVILDYSKTSSLDLQKTMPQMSLSVCIEVQYESSAARRRQLGGKLRIVSPDGQLEWICDKVLNAGRSLDGVWVGYTNFVPAPKEYFKSGTYSLFYEEESGQKIESSFEVTYPQELIEKGFSALDSISYEKEKLISLYDERGVLLYLDSEKDNSFEAKTELQYLLLNNGSVICILPVE